jgi:hypothetical protein
MNQSLMAAAETTLPPYLTTTTWPPDYSDDGSGEREESSGSGDYQFTGDTLTALGTRILERFFAKPNGNFLNSKYSHLRSMYVGMYAKLSIT